MIYIVHSRFFCCFFNTFLCFGDKQVTSDDRNFLDFLNPESLVVKTGCKAEKAIENYEVPANFQFMRQGYFCLDKDSTKDNIVFNRSVSLKDGFKKK